MLPWIDGLLQTAAVAMFAWTVGRWLIRRRPNPLAHSPERPNLLRVDAAMFSMLVYFATFVLMASILGQTGELKVATTPGLIAGLSAQLAGAWACLVPVNRSFNGGIRAFLLGPSVNERELRLPTLRIAAWAMLLALGLCPVLLGLTVAALRCFNPLVELPVHSTIQMLHDSTLPVWTVMVLWGGAVGVAPFAEELFFRGILQTLVFNATTSRAAAIGASSIAFSFAHVEQAYAIPALFVLAILLGYVYERTGTLLPCIGIHALFNLKTLIWDAWV